MCDRCGTVFSENEEGWGVGTISTSKRDERTGQMRMVQQSIDLCAIDNAGPTDHLSPQTRGQLTSSKVAGVAEAERLAATMVEPDPPVGPNRRTETSYVPQ